MQQLGTQERDLQATVTNNLQQLEIKKQADLLKLRDSFRQELNQINAQRGALAMNKANAQLQALQDYNNRKRQLEDMATQQRMSIESYAQQLALQARYTNQNQVTNIPNFSNMDAQGIADNINNLTTTNAGKIALDNAGWRGQNVNGREIWVNQRTGYTVDLSGKRYADWAIEKYNNLDKDSKVPLSQIQ
jgi:hypothetical protein